MNAQYRVVGGKKLCQESGSTMDNTLEAVCTNFRAYMRLRGYISNVLSNCNDSLCYLLLECIHIGIGLW